MHSKCLVFDSMLWAKYRKNGFQHSAIASALHRANIFSNEHLLVPINDDDDHWTLLIVCDPANIVVRARAHRKRTRMLYLDSADRVVDQHMDAVELMLQEEYLAQVNGRAYI